MQIQELNDSQIQIQWESVSGAVLYKVIISGLGANDTEVYENTTSETTYRQAGLEVGNYYSVLVKWKDSMGVYTDVEPSFLCSVGNGGPVVVVNGEIGITYYEGISSGGIPTGATINEDGNILLSLPSFASGDLQYALVYSLGSPYNEGQYAFNLYPITEDTKVAVSILPSSTTSPEDYIDITLYPYRG